MTDPVNEQPTTHFRFVRRRMNPDYTHPEGRIVNILQQQWAVGHQEIGEGGGLVWVRKREWRDVPLVDE